MTSIKRALLMLAIATTAVVSNKAIRAEEPATYTEEKIKTLIKGLGDEDFAKRQGAEKELMKAGTKAMEALKAAQASADPQIKATAAKLLGKLRLANLGAIDYFEAAPANSIIVLQIKNFGASLETAKKSAVGQLVFSAAMEPFRAKLDATLSADPEAKKQFLLWSERFKGQAAFAMWELKLAVQPPDMKLGAMLEITDPDPQAVFDDFVKQTDAMPGGVKVTNYKDVEIQQSAIGAGPALALVGKHMLIGPNVESLQKLVDGFLAPGGMAKSEAFLKAKASLGAKPEMLMAMDFQAYMKAAMSMNPMPGFEDMMKAAGVNVKHMFISSACIGESFEDRYVVVNDGPPLGLAGAAIPPPDAPPPANDMAIQPANAVLASVSYMDGAKLKTALSDYVGGLKKMIDGMKAQGAPIAVPMPDFDTALKDFEAKTGLKAADLAANIKGTIGYYVVLADGGLPAPPDIGMFITCADADKAKAFHEAVIKGFAAFDKKDAVKEVATPNATIYQLDLAALGMAIPPKFPYAPCWAMAGNRIFIASSAQALRKELSYIEKKTPGLLTQPDFMKAMGALNADERKGQMFYVDVKSLLTLGANVGLPLLQTQIADADMKKKLATLPPAADLFKNIPPLVATSTLQGNLAQSVMRSPLPPMQTIFLVAIGAGFGFMKGMPMGPADIAPGF